MLTQERPHPSLYLQVTPQGLLIIFVVVYKMCLKPSVGRDRQGKRQQKSKISIISLKLWWILQRSITSRLIIIVVYWAVSLDCSLSPGNHFVYFMILGKIGRLMWDAFTLLLHCSTATFRGRRTVLVWPTGEQCHLQDPLQDPLHQQGIQPPFLVVPSCQTVPLVIFLLATLHIMTKVAVWDGWFERL